MGQRRGELAKGYFVSNYIYIPRSDQSLSQRKMLGGSFSVLKIPPLPGSPRLKEVRSAAGVFPVSKEWAKTKTHMFPEWMLYLLFFLYISHCLNLKDWLKIA